MNISSPTTRPSYAEKDLARTIALPAESFAVEEDPLDSDLRGYVGELAKHPRRFQVDTGAGRIMHGLRTAPWPATDPTWEKQGEILCARIEEIVYPLAASLAAQAVQIEIAIGRDLHAPAGQPDALATYIVFDAEAGVMRHCFVAPHRDWPDAKISCAAAGLTVVSKPLHYHYHQLKEDFGGRPRHAASALPNRMWWNRNVDLPDMNKRKLVPSPVVSPTVHAAKPETRAAEKRAAASAPEARKIAGSALGNILKAAGEGIAGMAAFFLEALAPAEAKPEAEASESSEVERQEVPEAAAQEIERELSGQRAELAERGKERQREREREREREGERENERREIPEAFEAPEARREEGGSEISQRELAGEIPERSDERERTERAGAEREAPEAGPERGERPEIAELAERAEAGAERAELAERGEAPEAAERAEKAEHAEAGAERPEPVEGVREAERAEAPEPAGREAAEARSEGAERAEGGAERFEPVERGGPEAGRSEREVAGGEAGFAERPEGREERRAEPFAEAHRAGESPRSEAVALGGEGRAGGAEPQHGHGREAAPEREPSGESARASETPGGETRREKHEFALEARETGRDAAAETLGERLEAARRPEARERGLVSEARAKPGEERAARPIEAAERHPAEKPHIEEAVLHGTEEREKPSVESAAFHPAEKAAAPRTEEAVLRRPAGEAKPSVETAVFHPSEKAGMPRVEEAALIPPRVHDEDSLGQRFRQHKLETEQAAPPQTVAGKAAGEKAAPEKTAPRQTAPEQEARLIPADLHEPQPLAQKFRQDKFAAERKWRFGVDKLPQPATKLARNFQDRMVKFQTKARRHWDRFFGPGPGPGPGMDV